MIKKIVTRAKEPGDTICDSFNHLQDWFLHSVRKRETRSRLLYSDSIHSEQLQLLRHQHLSFHISTMVCPYKATCTLFAAMASIFYIRSTFDESLTETSYAEDGTVTTKPVPKKKAMSPLRRAVTISLLVAFHIDLMFTGYLRAGVKEGLAMLKA